MTKTKSVVVFLFSLFCLLSLHAATTSGEITPIDSNGGDFDSSSDSSSVSSSSSNTATPSGARSLVGTSVSPVISAAQGTASNSMRDNIQIDNNGAFKYSYPIKIPEGTHGVAPRLSLDYNSMAQNGMLGMGFALSGLSTIERDASYPINFNANDHYVLDGQKLYVKAADSIFPYVTYHTERESFDLITAYSSGTTVTTDPNTTTSYWLVRKKDGSKWYYGNTDDSRIDAVGKGGIPRLWALSKVEDSLGNYYTITYLEDTVGGDYYPSQIIYTKGAVTQNYSAYKSIGFSYESIADHYALYQPTLVNSDLRLKWITVKIGVTADGSGGSLLRKYGFGFDSATNPVYSTSTAGSGYAPSPGRSRLVSIQEYGSEGNWPSPGLITNYTVTGTSLPPVAISWKAQTSGLQSQVAESTVPNIDSTTQLYFTDVNGDGLSDLVAIPQPNQSNAGHVLIALRSLNGYTYWTSNIAMPNTTIVYSIHFSDVNGDRKSDLIAIPKENGSGAGHIFVGLSTGTQFTFWSSDVAMLDPDVPDLINFADINGDGRSDLVAIPPPNRWNSGRVYVGLSSGSQFGPWVSSVAMLDTNVSDIINFADVDGDGRSDLIAIPPANRWNSGRVYVGLSLGSEFGFWSWPGIPMLDANVDDSVYFADVNGDGRCDLINIPPTGQTNSGVVYIGLSTDTGFFPWSWYGSMLDSDASIAGTVFFADINGDGRSDLINIPSSDRPNAGYVKVGLSSVVTFGQDRRIGFDLCSWSGQILATDSTCFLAEANGDDRIDLITANPSLGISHSFSLYNPDLISSITLPSGGTITPTFVQAPVVQGAIVPNASYYPYVPNTGGRQLVISIIYSDGLGDTTTSTFNYNAGKNRSGYPSERRNLGFEHILKMTTFSTGECGPIKTEHRVTSYRMDPPFQGLVSEVFISDKQELPLQSVIYEYQKIDAGAEGSSFVFLHSTKVMKCDGSYQSPVFFKTDYDYDAFGNMRRQSNLGEVFLASGVFTNATTADDVIDETIYTIPTSAYYFSLPQHAQTATYDENNSLGVSAETSYFYDSSLVAGSVSKGLLTRIDRRMDSSTVATETRGYDLYGNVLWIKDPRTNAITGSMGLTNEFTYDTIYNCYQKTSKNAKGYIITTNYNLLLLPFEIIDINSQVTRTYYDQFGRIVSVFLPGDSTTSPSTIINYNDTLFPRMIHTSKKDSVSGYLETWDFYDGFGRIVRSTREASFGQYISTETYYDGMGRVSKTSVPYSSSSAVWNTRVGRYTIRGSMIDYDNLGRVVLIGNPDGTTRRTIYNIKSTMLVDENGHVVENYSNANTNSERRYTGVYPNIALYSTTTMTAYRGGFALTDNTGKSLRYSVDMLGRTKSISCPDMTNSWVFTYDANGNIISRTDARGITVLMSYDVLNRLVKSDYPSLVDTNYYYDESGHGAGALGRLTSVNYERGSEAYTYDLRGRIISKTKSLDGISRSMSASYDFLDRLATQTFPDGETVTYTYGNDGNLLALAGSNNYIHAISYTYYNKIESYVYGNGITFSFDYYDDSSKVDNTANRSYSYQLRNICAMLDDQYIENITYSYDLRKNIKTKIDGIDDAFNETFDYDDLDRLISANTSSVSSYGLLTFSYDTLDCLTSKSGIAYTYNSQHPHTPSCFGGIAYTYDANGSRLTSTDGKAFTYDDESRLRGVTGNGIQLETNIYGVAFDRRIKETGTKKTLYFFSEYEEEYTNNVLIRSIKRYSAAGISIAQRTSDTGLSYLLSDHLGSVVATIDASSNIARKGYQPYGTDAYVTGAISTRYQFTDQENDLGTGLYNFNARYYDPELGIFTSVDPAIMRNIGLSIREIANPYTYCGDNPINFIDPSGLGALPPSYGPIGPAPGDDMGGAVEPYPNGAPGKTKPDPTDNGNGNPSSAPSSIVTRAVQVFLSGLVLPINYTLSFLNNIDELIINPITEWSFGMSSYDFFLAVGLAEFELGGVYRATNEFLAASKVATTAHGAERLAGAAATRGGVLAAGEVSAVQQGGRLMTANNGTTVRLMEQANGRFSAVVTNAEGKIVTTMKDWSAKSIERISRNYGWTAVE